MGAKSDVVVKLVLVFFISLLSFAIGTFVGKKYSDNQHKLAKLEPEVKDNHGERSVASEHGTSAAAHSEKSEMVSDDEIKKLTEETLKKEEFVADDTKTADPHAKSEHHGEKPESHGVKHEAATTKEDSHEEKPAKKETHNEKMVKPASETHGKAAVKSKNAHDETLAAAQAFLDGKTPEVKEEVKKESRIPSSLPKDVAQYAVGKFTVQIASYAEKADAEKKANKLKEMGYQANVFSAQVSGKTWYRVSFGLFATQDEAQAEKQKYLDKNKTESALVQKIKN